MGLNDPPSWSVWLSRPLTFGLEATLHTEAVRGNDFTYAFEIALAYEHLGDRESALEWLERSEKAGTHSFNMIEPDPRLSGLQNSPRYRRLVEKLQRPK